MWSTIWPAAIIAMGGLLTGLLTGSMTNLTARKRNRQDAMSALMTDALGLVQSLQAEVTRRNSEIDHLNTRIHDLEVQFGARVKELEARIDELKQENMALKGQQK